MRILCSMALVMCMTSSSAVGAVLYESGSLGPAGVPWQSVINQTVLGENVSATAFNGVRFELTQSVRTIRVGGHLVAPPNDEPSKIFVAVVQLDNQSDFPNSTDLSTSDVLGKALISIPDHSAEVFADLSLLLEPGWYALIFGSGHFKADGHAAALLNNSDIGAPDYIGFMTGFGWGARLPSKRFVVEGDIVPEPCAAILFAFAWTFMHNSKRVLRR